MAEAEQAGRGDLDRLLIEWRSLLKQLAAAEPLTIAERGVRNAEGADAGVGTAHEDGAAAHGEALPEQPAGGRGRNERRAGGAASPNPGLALAARWDALRARAQAMLERLPRTALPELPPLPAEQRRR
jgi:hypothetical protein